MRLKLSIRLSSSSLALRRGMLSERLEPVISCAVAATRFSGRMARPASAQPSNPVTKIIPGSIRK